MVHCVGQNDSMTTYRHTLVTVGEMHSFFLFLFCLLRDVEISGAKSSAYKQILLTG